MALEQESERNALATSRRSHQVGVGGYRTGRPQAVLHTTMMPDSTEKFD